MDTRSAGPQPGRLRGRKPRWSRFRLSLEHGLLAGLILLAALPFACRRRVDEHRTVLRFWSGGRPQERKLFTEAARAFEEMHPGVKIKLEVPGQGQGWGKILTAMQAGSCGDVLFVHWTVIPTLASKRCLLRLDDLARRDDYDLSDFFPGGIEAYSYRDALYALPFKGSTMVMFYNKDLFDEAGLPYPTDDWTWDDLLRAAKKLTRTDGTGRMTQVGCLPYDPSTWVWSGGGEFADDACEHVYFTSDATLKGLEFYEGLRNRWKVATRNMTLGGADPMAVDVFERGHVGMDISGPWRLPKYMRASEQRSLRWDIALMPRGPAGRQTRYAGMGIAVWADSPRKQLAWEFSKYLCGPEAMRRFSEGWLDIPARRSLAYGTFGRQEAPFDVQVLLRSMEPAHGRVRVYPKSDRWGEIFRFFRQEYGGALIGRQTVAEAMTAAEEKVQRYLAEKAATAGTCDYVGIALLALLGVGVTLWRLRRSGREGRS